MCYSSRYLHDYSKFKFKCYNELNVHTLVHQYERSAEPLYYKNNLDLPPYHSHNPVNIDLCLLKRVLVHKDTWVSVGRYKNHQCIREKH